MTWTINAELADVTVIQPGCTHAFNAIEIHCNGVWPNGKGPALLLEDWSARGYDDDDKRDLTPSDDATTLANQIVTAVNCHADLLATLEAGAKAAGKVDHAKDLPGKIRAEASLYNWANSARAAIAKARNE